MYQVLAMQNFVQGHGISLSYVLPGDLSTTVYEPLINWPPGYSVLLSPFYLLSGSNYIVAGLILDISAAIFLIFISRRILKLVDIPLYLINIFTLLTSFFIYYFYSIASSDAIAVVFFLSAILFALKIIKGRSASVKTIIILSLCLFSAGFIKYLFIPVVFIIPVFLFWKGYTEKKFEVRKSGLISFLTLVIFFSAVLLIHKIVSGSAIYISEPKRGFFPENLLSMWPAYPASFLKPDSVELLVSSSHGFGFRIFQWLHLIFFAIAAFWILKLFLKKGFKKLSLQDSFFAMGFFISGGITILLATLSLFVGKEENIPGHWWTYIEEPRYYGLVNVLIHLGTFILFSYGINKKSRSFNLIFAGLILLLLPETIRGAIFTTKRLLLINKEEYSWQYEYSIQNYADKIIKNEKSIHPERKIIVTGSSYYTYYRVSINSQIPVLNEVAIINEPQSLKTKEPVTVLVILEEKALKGFRTFLSGQRKDFAGEYRGFYFYKIHVEPH